MNEHCVYRSNEKEKPFQSIWTCLFVAPYTATERHFDKLEEEEKKKFNWTLKIADSNETRNGQKENMKLLFPS